MPGYGKGQHPEHYRPGEKRRELEESFEELANALLRIEDAIGAVLLYLERPTDESRVFLADANKSLREVVNIARRLQLKFGPTRHLRSGA